MPRPDLSIRGRTGLKAFSGVVDEELSRQLRNYDTRIKTYQEMRDNDPVVGAIQHVIEMLLRNVEWNVEPASASREDEANAEFLRECRDDMSASWTEFITEALSMLPLGYSWHEQVWKIRGGDVRNPERRSKFNDGRVGWRKFAIRSQDSLSRWQFDEEGGVQGFWQIAPPVFREKLIPIDKSLLFRASVYKSNPEGRSIYRSAVRSWYYVKRLQEIEAVGVERELAGLPDMQVPPEMMMSDADAALVALRADLEEMLGDIKRDERAFIMRPAETDREGKTTGYKFGLVSTGGTRQIDTNEIITRYEQRIAMSVAAEFVFLGMQQVGSFALASSKTHLFGVALGAWLQSIASVLNQHAVPPLFRLNGIVTPDLPKFVPTDVETPPLDELSAYISALAKVGVIIPDEALQREVRRIASLPEPDEDSAMFVLPDGREIVTARGSEEQLEKIVRRVAKELGKEPMMLRNGR